MIPSLLRATSFAAVLLVLGSACDRGTAALGPPNALIPLTETTVTGAVGSAVSAGIKVQVVDSRGHTVSDARVQFRITAGDGTATPQVFLSDASGIATAAWTLGRTAGDNQVTAEIDGVDSVTTFNATGVPGPSTTLSTYPHTLRLPVGTNSSIVAATLNDQYGNPIATSGVTYTSTNPALFTVNSATGVVTVVSRGASAFIVSAGAGFVDTATVVVLQAGDTPCTGITARASMAVGQVVTSGFSDNGICVNSTTSAAEYAIVPYLDSPVTTLQASVMMTAFGGSGTVPPLSTALVTDRRPFGLQSRIATPSAASIAFENGLRRREQQGIMSRADNARRWFADKQSSRTAAARVTNVPAVGDRLQLNADAINYCAAPTYSTGRVVAVTQKAIVVADTANPDGFTDAEYQSLGATFDTLVYPLDVSTFGAPTDIDDNGRIILFFTKAVNDLGGGVLGYFYGRDMLPKSGPLGTCPGSNVGEIMFLFVPDPSSYSKSYVLQNTSSTEMHEMQHLINASRRLYVNTTAIPMEERWLNEGMSHAAEELLFYRASGLAPRQNLGTTIFSPTYFPFFSEYQTNNIGRFQTYIQQVGIQSPVGVDDGDDDIGTRGAIWSFLRYVADQRFSATESAFWQSLVNAKTTGMTTLNAVVGSDVHLMMRDWSLSVLLDDLVPTNAAFQQPSWNLRAVIGGYAPVTENLTSSTPVQRTIRAGGTVFGRFALAANQEGYVTVTGAAGAQLSNKVLLALVRTK